jgi:O-antigen/teichoic acid export membrane protein
MKELLKKFSAFSVGPMVGAILSFITVPLITHFISPDEYGKSSMFTVAQGTVSMLIYLGMDQAFVREFNLSKDRLDKLMSNAIAIPLLLSLVLDIVILTNVQFVSYILFDDKTEFTAVYLMALMLPFMVIETFSYLKIRMEEKGLTYSFFTILLKLFILIFTIILFLTYEKSFRSVVYAMALAEIANGIILYFLVISPMGLSFKYMDKPLLMQMLKFGLPLVPATLLGWALTSMDKVMLRGMDTYTELGLYTAAFKIVSVLSIVQSCFTLFWAPVAYRWHDSKVPLKNFDNVCKVVAGLMSILCLGLLLCKDLVAIILGSSFAESMYIFPFLLLNPIMYTMSETVAVGIAFSRKTHYTIIVSAISGGVNIVLNYLLIPEFQATGAAIATGISYLVFFWARTFISRKLWWKFPIDKFVIYTIMILINCTIHTFVHGWLPYIVSAVSIILILLLNVGDAKGLLSMMKEER